MPAQSEQTTCAIWGTAARDEPTSVDGRLIESARAGGRYICSGTAIAALANLSDSEKMLLTTWLIEQRRLGISCPEILTNTISDISKIHPPSVFQRADELLRYLRDQSDVLGSVLKFYAEDNARNPEVANELLAWTHSSELKEVITLAEYCHDEGWIEHRVTERTSGSQNDVHEMLLRPPGYSRLAELEGSNSGSTRAFVAMWFDSSMNDAYNDGIEPAILDAGYESVRIDRTEHNNKIDDEIIAEIRRSRFLVADFTQGESGARGGVYYEAGFAHGLNLPVIFTCRTDAIDKVHFDTRQYNHIVWDTPEDLREKLAKRISATLGDGPNK